MYEVPDQNDRPGCRDVWALSLAVFSVVAPVVAVIVVLLGALIGAFVLFTIHPAFALLPIAAVVIGVGIFARWEQGSFRPPGR